MANPRGINQYTKGGGKGFGIKNPKPMGSYFVRNKSASHQFTVKSRTSLQARKIGEEILGGKNKSLLSATKINKVAGYGKQSANSKFGTQKQPRLNKYKSWNGV